MIDYSENKAIIEGLLRSTERPGVENLLIYLEVSGFYEAPGSTKYHLSEPGGLAQHSINVLNAMTALIRGLRDVELTPRLSTNEIPLQRYASIVLCALLHDLGKAGQFAKPQYIEKEIPFGDPPQYEYNRSLLYIPHEVRSVVIASQYIQLTEEEQFAILYHNGLYGDFKKAIPGKETPLYMLLHFADMWAARVIEKEV